MWCLSTSSHHYSIWTFLIFGNLPKLAPISDFVITVLVFISLIFENFCLPIWGEESFHWIVIPLLSPFTIRFTNSDCDNHTITLQTSNKYKWAKVACWLRNCPNSIVRTWQWRLEQEPNCGGIILFQLSTNASKKSIKTFCRASLL